MKQFTLFFLKKTSTTKFLFIATTPFLALLMNLKELIFGLTILIGLDLITGIVKYFHTNEIKFQFKKKATYVAIKSELLRKTLRKTYEYGIMIIVGILLEEILFQETIIQIQDKKMSISQLAIIMPMAIEIWSIFENVEEVTNNNILKKFYGFLPNKIKVLLKSTEKKKL